MKRNFTKKTLSLSLIFSFLFSISSFAQTITVDTSIDDWATAVNPTPTVIGSSGNITVTVWNDPDNLYVWIHSETNLWLTNDTYINMDCDTETGYNGGTFWPNADMGADILVQGSSYYASAFTSTNGSAFTWNFLGAAAFGVNSYDAGATTDIEFSIPLSPGCGTASIAGCYREAVDNGDGTFSQGPDFCLAAAFTPYALVGVALPVELVSFNGRSEDKFSNLLNWSTETEIDNDYFTIQKSKDGLTWNDATMVSGQGTSFVPQNYEWVDKNPFKKSYYRLKQTDFSSKSSYSSVISIENKEVTSTRISPNPATNNTVVYSTDIQDMDNVKLYDQLGRDITSKVGMDFLSTESLNIDFSSLNSGLYYLRLVDETHPIQVVK